MIHFPMPRHMQTVLSFMPYTVVFRHYVLYLFQAISRRATLYKMIRDYDQAANDVRKLISLLEKKVNVSGVSPKAFNKHNDLKQAHVRLSSIEDEAKNDTPLNLYLIL
jgi:DnaJ homolog subfamily C member 7